MGARLQRVHLEPKQLLPLAFAYSPLPPPLPLLSSHPPSPLRSLGWRRMAQVEFYRSTTEGSICVIFFLTITWFTSGLMIDASRLGQTPYLLLCIKCKILHFFFFSPIAVLFLASILCSSFLLTTPPTSLNSINYLSYDGCIVRSCKNIGGKGRQQKSCKMAGLGEKYSSKRNHLRKSGWFPIRDQFCKNQWRKVLKRISRYPFKSIDATLLTSQIQSGWAVWRLWKRDAVKTSNNECYQPHISNNCHHNYCHDEQTRKAE